MGKTKREKKGKKLEKSVANAASHLLSQVSDDDGRKPSGISLSLMYAPHGMMKHKRKHKEMHEEKDD